jgi:hypothetical protein
MPNDVYGCVAVHVQNRQQNLSRCTFCRSPERSCERFTSALTRSGALTLSLYLGSIGTPHAAAASLQAELTPSFKEIWVSTPLAVAHVHTLWFGATCLQFTT